MKRALLHILVLAIVAGAIGCGGNKKPKNAPINQWLLEQQVDVPPSVYRVQPPDAIRVMAPRIKELDGQGGQIRPDGKISLNLVGEVYVAGMTPEEISQLLARIASKYYQVGALDVNVQVTEFKSKVFYVFGQVYAPGVKPYTGRNTVISVLAEARLNDFAWPQKIVVVRPNEDPNIRQRVTVDLKKMYTTGSTEQNFLLEEGDVIYIPPSPLAELNLTFNRLLLPILPATRMATMAQGGI